jgi:hypothetical protein
MDDVLFSIEQLETTLWRHRCSRALAPVLPLLLLAGAGAAVVPQLAPGGPWLLRCRYTYGAGAAGGGGTPAAAAGGSLLPLPDRRRKRKGVGTDKRRVLCLGRKLPIFIWKSSIDVGKMLESSQITHLLEERQFVL